MNKQFLNLSIASVISLSGAIPVYAEAEECVGVEVQSRFALVNCLVESAVAVAAAAASQNGCQAGEWAIDAIVPELYLSTIPVQGLMHVYNAEEAYEMGGQSSAMTRNEVNCQIATTASGNEFAGEPLTYSTGSGNFYVDALIDRDSDTVCITESLSSGDIALGDAGYDEVNSLSFQDELGAIEASGLLTILENKGKGDSPTKPPVVLSIWTVEESVSIPELGETNPEGFKFEAITNDIDSGCEIEIEGAVINLVNYVIENEKGGLTISGTIEIEPEQD